MMIKTPIKYTLNSLKYYKGKHYLFRIFRRQIPHQANVTFRTKN